MSMKPYNIKDDELVPNAENAEVLRSTADSAVVAQRSERNFQEYQSEFLKSVVTECMDEFATTIVKKLWHLDWDITKLGNELNTKIDSLSSQLEKIERAIEAPLSHEE